MENVNRMKKLRRGKGSLTRERMSISGTRNNKMKREEKRGEREEKEGVVNLEEVRVSDTYGKQRRTVQYSTAQ